MISIGQAPAAPAPQRCQLGSIGGEVLPDWHSVVWGYEGLLLDQWVRDGRARLIKHGPRRAVYRVEVGDQKLYVKHYRCHRWWQAIGHLFRPSASRREFGRAREVLERKLPTAAPVAWFESRRRGLVYDNYLVTRAIDGACSLDDFMRTVVPHVDALAAVRLRGRLAVSLAHLCATAHRQGIDHDDLHAGNVLVRYERSAQVDDGLLPELYLIDLPGVRLSRPLSRRQSIISLTKLGAAFAGIATPREILRFWKAYVRERPDVQWGDSRGVARRIVEAIPAARRRVAHSRDKRSLRTNRDFYLGRHGSSTGVAVRDYSAEHFTELLADPRGLLNANLHRPYKLSHRSMVVRADLLLGGQSVEVAYKRVRPRNWWKTLLHYFRRNPALEAWRYGHALLERGIATARPLALIERPRFGLPAEGYLATQWIAGANNLHVYAWQLVKRPPAERRRRVRQVAESLGRLLGRMHSWHVSHRDLKGCNVLVVEHENDVDCYLIDADSVRIPRRLSPFFRSFNLARLATSIEAYEWVSRADRLRFLRAYLSELHRRDPRAWPANWKQAWRAVAKATRSIIGRLRRGGRDIL